MFILCVLCVLVFENYDIHSLYVPVNIQQKLLKDAETLCPDGKEKASKKE